MDSLIRMLLERSIMKVINKDFKKEDMTRGKYHTKGHKLPEKNLNDNNIDIKQDGHYLVISQKESTTEELLSAVYNRMLVESKPLDPEFAKILSDNIFELF